MTILFLPIIFPLSFVSPFKEIRTMRLTLFLFFCLIQPSRITSRDMLSSKEGYNYCRVNEEIATKKSMKSNYCAPIVQLRFNKYNQQFLLSVDVFDDVCQSTVAFCVCVCICVCICELVCVCVCWCVVPCVGVRCRVWVCAALCGCMVPCVGV